MDGSTRVYRNDGGDTFTDAEAGLEGVMAGRARWGDYDGDGDLDFVLIGQNDLGQPTVNFFINRNFLEPIPETGGR